MATARVPLTVMLSVPILIQWGLALTGGYLLGAISGALVLGRAYGVDIRTAGSGNAGGTNALRTVGWRFALGVVLIDLGKGVVAATLVPWMVLRWVSGEANVTDLAICAGFGAVIGHIWPVYFGFRGGKGAGTAIGVIAVIAPTCLVPMLTVWLVSVLASGYVGLSTILAGLTLVPAMAWLGPSPLPPMLWAFALGIAGLLVLTHRANLVRMARGNENRFDTRKIWRRKPR